MWNPEILPGGDLLELALGLGEAAGLLADRPAAGSGAADVL